MRWRVQVLGRLVLSRGESVITRFESRKVASLLAYLALHPRRSHPREELIELLWPDVEPEKGRARFRQALSSLRHQLEPPGAGAPGTVLVADRQSVYLHPDAFTCDAALFQQALRQKRFADARAIYGGGGGGLLPGFYDDWILLERSRLAELYEGIENGKDTTSPPEPLTRAREQGGPRHFENEDTVLLPVYLTTFFGREPEVRQLQAWLGAAARRLVTITGMGGIGKTRIAVEVARAMAAEYDIVAFAALSDCVAPTQAAEQIRASLFLPASRTDALEQIAQRLAGQKTLLVLDNFEQLVENGGAEVVGTLMARLPDLTCLITSRRLSGVPGEQEFPLTPLPSPAPGTLSLLGDIAVNPSVALFLNRAQAVRPGFQLTENNRVDLVTLCRALEGIPLALELAASRLRAFAPAEMSRQIQTRLRWLVRSGPGADKEPRHRSLAATLEWSWHLLTPPQRTFLSALSVFRGGWTAEAAVAVCEQEDARERLESLVMDSLVFSEETPEGTTRFFMLETVRAFVQERLDPGAVTILRRRHQEHFLAKAMRSTGVGESLVEEASNLQAALETAIEGDGADMAFALCVAGGERWPSLTGLRPAAALFTRTLRLSGGSPRARMETLHLAAYFVMLAQGQAPAWKMVQEAEGIAGCRPIERALALVAQARVGLAGYRTDDFSDPLREALALARAAGEGKIAGRALHLLGVAATRRGDFFQAQECLTEALELLNADCDWHGVSYAIDSLANTAVQSGDLDRALQLYLDSQQRAAAFGDVLYEAKIYQNLATVYARQERWKESIAAGQECIRRSYALGNAYIVSFALWNLAEPFTWIGKAASAAQLVSFSARVWTSEFGPLSEEDASYGEMILTRVSDALGAERAADLWRLGEELSTHEAVALALERSF